jgi:hypothetical protein
MVLVLLLAASLRLSGVAWDGGIGAHPDERYVVGVAEGVTGLDRLDLLALAPQLAYGHLPIYLMALMGGQDRLAAARLLAALFDVGTVALAGGLGRRLGGRRVGLLAAAFLAVMPLHVQQAHFATVDPFLAFCVTATLLFATRLAQDGRLQDAALGGAWAGLAVGCKAGALLLVLPLAVAYGLSPGGGRRRVRSGLAVGSAAVTAFALTNPFALLRFPQFMHNVAAQAALARGAVVVPYTLQYRATLPYLYPLEQLTVWGMGPILGVVCVLGLMAAFWVAVRHPPTAPHLIGLAWALPFLAFTAGLFAKFPRYLLPATPLLAIFGAQCVFAIGDRVRRGRVVHLVLATAAALPAGLASLALVSSYRLPHPWVAASAWLADHLPPGALVAVEDWDHPLPVGTTQVAWRTLPVFEPESDGKWALIEATLAQADTVVVASRRGYAALARSPERYHGTLAYYRDLFGGRLGFRPVACFGRWPRVGPVALADDPFRAAGLPSPDPGCAPGPPVLWLPSLDESFVVYDHPLVVILQRVEGIRGGERW